MAFPDNPLDVFFDLVPTGAVLYTPLYDASGELVDFRFARLNPAGQRLLGLPAQPPHTFREYYPNSVPTGIFAQYCTAFLTGQPMTYEVPYTGEGLDTYFRLVAQRSGELLVVNFTDLADLPRAAAEQALRESQEKYRALVDFIPAAVYACHADATLAYYNARAVELWGRAPARQDTTWTLGGSWCTYLPDGTRLEPGESLMAGVLATGEPVVNREVKIERPDHSIIDILVNITPMHDAAGGITGAVNIFQDITERKRVEAALHQSEEQFRHFVTTSSDMLYRMSPNWRQMLTLVGKNFLADTPDPSTTWVEKYIPQEEQARAWATIHAAIAAKSIFELEHRVYRADGTVAWTASRAVPVLDAQGEIVEWFGAATDITARKQAEEALRRSEERLHLALQAGHMGSFEWTSADNRLRLSALSEQVLGLLPGTPVATGATGLTLVHPDDRARQQAIFEQASRTGEDFHSIYRIVRPRDGQVRWLEERGQGTRDPTTGSIQLRGVHWDVTERVQAQQQLTEFNLQLEQQVSARTQELQQSRRLLQTVFDASPTAIVVLRILRDAADQPADFEILLYNEFNKQVVGRDDLAGQRYSEVFAQTVPTGNLARLLAVATTGEPADFEQWYAGEGMQHWFRQIAVRQDGLLVLTSEVITARKQAEQERLRNLHLLEQAEAVAGLGSWDYDLLSKVFLWSTGLYQLFGLPRGQAITPSIYLDYVVAEDRPVAERLVQCLTTGSTGFEEILRLRVGEQVKTVRSKTVVLHDEAGKPVRVLGVDLDITQLQRLEADNLRLRLSQQRALFEAVQAAQEVERKRIAESLHNGIGQILYATKLRFDQLHAPVPHTLPALVAARHEADHLLSEAIRQTRVLSHELVPLMLEKFGLRQALHYVGRDMSTAHLRFHCQVLFDEEAAPLSPALQLALYRMAQELALNIVKHAYGATEASLELETMPGWVVLRAEDNGPGFAPAPVERPGLGLRSIRDRVVLLEGQLEMGGRLDGGAYVRIRIPLGTSATL